LEQILDLVSQIGFVQTDAARLEALVEDLDGLDQAVGAAQGNLDGIIEFQREALEVLGVCPTCGQELSAEVVERMTQSHG